MIFSVIVPFLNEEIFIERCLQALLQQSFDSRDYEIICIDNGSTDGSLAIVHRYPVTVLHESRQDPYLARNCGIRAARGRFLAFTDADCIVDRHWLAGLHQHLEGTDADIVLGRLLYPAPTPASLQCYEQYYHTKLMYIYGQKLMPYYYGHAGNMAVRAPVFQQVGLFSGMPIVGDTEIIHNLLWHRPKANITYAPEAKAVHAEVTRFRHCMCKLFQCGQYTETYSACSTYRPLSLQDKVHVVQHCLAAYPYGLCRKFTLGNMLLMGFLCFTAGRLSRRFLNLNLHTLCGIS